MVMHLYFAESCMLQQICRYFLLGIKTSALYMSLSSEQQLKLQEFTPDPTKCNVVFLTVCAVYFKEHRVLKFLGSVPLEGIICSRDDSFQNCFQQEVGFTYSSQDIHLGDTCHLILLEESMASPSLEGAWATRQSRAETPYLVCTKC